MTWFSDLFGFDESRAAVRAQLTVQGASMTSKANGRTFGIGSLTTPSLAELRAGSEGLAGGGRLRVQQEVADVSELHGAPENEGALFQVASQFNLLEMVDPSRSPEDGITCYAHDFTQGPACAMAAAAATLYRNDFVPLGDRVGQTADRQLDTLQDLGSRLGNGGERLWTMRNGYALCTAEGLDLIGERLAGLDEAELDELRGLLRIGVHSDVEVTRDESGKRVTQAFCSALPVAYCSHDEDLWEPFARIVLEAAYEATLLAALQNARGGGSNRVFLTLLGGGAFGNRQEWIFDALRRALLLAAGADLDVRVVSFGQRDPSLDVLLEELP